MHLFDKDARIHKYRTPEEVLESFFTLRMHYYERRKAHLLAELQAEWTPLDNKVRFILMVVNGKLVAAKAAPKAKARAKAKAPPKRTIKGKGKGKPTVVCDDDSDNGASEYDGACDAAALPVAASRPSRRAAAKATVFCFSGSEGVSDEDSFSVSSDEESDFDPDDM